MFNRSFLVGCGVGGGGKRFWRISSPGTAPAFGEVTLYATAGEAGYGLFVGGSSTASSEYDSSTLAEYLTDKNPNTYWWTAASGAWWQYELSGGINPVEIVIVSTQIGISLYDAFDLYWSETGVEGTFVLQKSFPQAYFMHHGSSPDPITGGAFAWSRLSLL